MSNGMVHSAWKLVHAFVGFEGTVFKNRRKPAIWRFALEAQTYRDVVKATFQNR